MKNGTFPKTHVSQSKAMRDKGIHCVQTQDYEERHKQGLYADGQMPLENYKKKINNNFNILYEKILYYRFCPGFGGSSRRRYDFLR